MKTLITFFLYCSFIGLYAGDNVQPIHQSKNISNMDTITPKPLQKGAKVAIIAPARKFSFHSIEPAIDSLQKWGYEVVLGKNLLKESHQFSGTDKERIEDFQWALDDDSIDAILCARGGYGSVRLIDSLDFTKFKQRPKWIVGYSDITVFHEHINQNFDIATMHAIMPVTFDDATPKAIETFRAAIEGRPYSIELKNENNLKEQVIKGEIVGGNLSIIYSLLGSESSIKTDEKILFIEDLDEYLYHIDRMMMNLKRNGLLKNLKALIVGGMTDMHDNQVPFGKNASQIIHDVCGEYSFPIIENFPAGHIKDNQAIIFNKEVEIQIDTEKIKVQF